MNGLMVGSMPKRGGFVPKAATKGKSKPQLEVQTKEMEARKKQILELLDEIGKRLGKEES